MHHLTLTRMEQTADGVFGILQAPGLTDLHTMEDDWKDNAKGESCIPAGIYLLHRTIFHKHGYEAFEVAGVPGRSRILIHIANTEEDVEGCIGVGTRRGLLRVPDEDNPAHPVVEKRAVVDSRAAFAALMSYLSDTDEASLTVAWAGGLPHSEVS